MLWAASRKITFFVRLGVDETIKPKVRRCPHSIMLLVDILSLDESCLEKHVSIFNTTRGSLHLNNRFTVGNHQVIINMETDN